MRIVLAHPSPVRRARLSRQLRTNDSSLHLIGLAQDLTELYTLTEHEGPDAVLVEWRFAGLPEFVVMHALFRALDVVCILLCDAGKAADTQFARNLPVLGPEPDSEEVIRLIKRHRAALHGDAPPGRRKEQSAKPAVGGWKPGSIVLLAASTGGVEALLDVLGTFPADCPPTLVVQHTGGSFAQSLIRLVDSRCTATVAPGRDGEAVRSGHVYFAPDDTAHLALATDAAPRIHLDPSPPVGGHRPAADVLFNSARGIAANVSAAILTGMGRDGAEGLLGLRQAGARTFAQDEASSVVYGMPRAAWEIGAAQARLPLRRIGPALLEACRPAAPPARPRRIISASVR
ncbi:CheB methylesterase domain-containing protein [Histidinibacterium aquaticum]|uniref:protein-glutamate methylesterase n=1 Tax=Histidinibacterium aquaticum TaxID=2613962 RepID=A0A5J5GIB1_9RHOB|nr:CheB methylesterase domain-containing protein [Histidinibacterium aquaticum]KAA9007966.1 chemotaxis protein CheB [Histidinibacterium aquaticum]